MNIEINKKGVYYIISEFMQEQINYIRKEALYADHINGEVALNIYADRLEETLKELQNDEE